MDKYKKYYDKHKNDADFKAKNAARAKLYYQQNKDKVKRYTEINRQKIADRMKTWRLENRAKLNQYQNERRAQNPGDRKGESGPDYYQKNRTRILYNQRNYEAKNPDKRAERGRRWRLEHSAEVRLQVHKYRTKTKGVQISKEEIYNWFTRICGICKEPITENFEIDHIIPLSRGGLHEVLNLQLAHPHCNRVKHNKLPSELLMV